MNTKKTILPNGNIELEMHIPWQTIQDTYAHVIDDITKEAELPGFRKGKAPKEKVEETLDKTKTYEEVLKRVIPELYAAAVKEHALKPIVSPSITLKNAKEGEDWTVLAVTCEKPDVTLGDYKKAIKELKTSKAQKLWVPGEEKKEEKKEEEAKKPSLDDIIGAVLSTMTVTVPAILLEQETTRLLSRLIDQTKKLGLTIEQYITSTGRTSEQLQKEYAEEARKTIMLELALETIAEQEHVTVEEKEIDAMIETAQTPEEKKALEHERYYIASLLRRQKTMHLLSEV